MFQQARSPQELSSRVQQAPYLHHHIAIVTDTAGAFVLDVIGTKKNGTGVEEMEAAGSGTGAEEPEAAGSGTGAKEVAATGSGAEKARSGSAAVTTAGA